MAASKEAQGEAQTLPLPERTCSMCGTPVPTPAKRGRGRPQEYCSYECKELNAAITIMSGWLDRVVPHMTLEKKRKLRGTMQSMINATLNGKGGP
jgi:endogenous inhibitor of DNA gyrase (YacG/DUF329 family)